MAINHEKPDRVPRGEFYVEEAFLNRFLPQYAKASYGEKLRLLIEELRLDLVTIRVDDQKEEEGLREIERWVSQTDYFVMALVDGLFWRPKDDLSFEEFLVRICRGDPGMRQMIRMKKEKVKQLVKRCLNQGADGCMIGDDLAFNGGPFLSPKELRSTFFPELQEITEAVRDNRGIAFLHSCGNLTELIAPILAVGFNGLHGLAPSAGNDPLSIRQRTKGKLCLMGVFQVDCLDSSELEASKEAILPSLAAGGGYVLGSSEGLSKNTPLNSIRTLYELEKFHHFSK
jgi:uroporphyrinogen decarboxylase